MNLENSKKPEWFECFELLAALVLKAAKTTKKLLEEIHKLRHSVYYIDNFTISKDYIQKIFC